MSTSASHCVAPAGHKKRGESAGQASHVNLLKLLVYLARPKRFELLTPRFVV